MILPMPDLRRILPLLALATFVAGSLIVVGPQKNRNVEMQQDQVPLTSRSLRFEDMPDGAIIIRDASDDALLGRFGVGEGAFIRGTMRALTRERRAEGEGQEKPFRLTAWPNGQLTLDDAATGRRIDITAFGPAQAEAFQRFLAAPGE